MNLPWYLPVLGIVAAMLASPAAAADPPAPKKPSAPGAILIQGKSPEKRFGDPDDPARLAKHYAALDLIRAGEALFQQGKYAEAIRTYQKSIETRPSSDAYVKMGDALMALRRVEEALACYREAIVPPPGRNWYDGRTLTGDLQFKFALLLADLGRNAEAMEMFRRGVARVPDDRRYLFDLPLRPERLDRKLFTAAAYVGLGLVSGNHDVAIAHYEQALRLKPTFAPAYLATGDSLLVLEREEEARRMYEKARRYGRGRLAQEAQEELSGGKGIVRILDGGASDPAPPAAPGGDADGAGAPGY